MKISRKAKGKFLKTAALTIDVGAPLIATLTQFPVWVERSAGSTVSGIFVVFALISAIPIFKQTKQLIQSPSVPIIWTIGLFALITLRNIVDEMIVICLVGAISNSIGTVLFKTGEKNLSTEAESGKDNI